VCGDLTISTFIASGKTTVARLYARFLNDFEVLPGCGFLETTGSVLGAKGIRSIQEKIQGILDGGGGTIFVDEAYQLTNSGTSYGREVLDFLLTEMENNTGKLVFIFAGYNREMERFLEHNPGLQSRVPYTLQFDDYSNDELMDMFESMLHTRYQGKMSVADVDGIRGLYGRIVIRRLGRGRGRRGFGNARALENVVQRIEERQAARLKKQRREGLRTDDFVLIKEDLIGPNPTDVLVQSAEYKKLQGMLGLQNVKKSVDNLFEMAKTNYERELREKEPSVCSICPVFQL
jgi:replication-associated recombination protein RarA